jgi:hypothetical protein
MTHALLALALAAAPDASAVEKEVRDAEARFNAAYAANDMKAYWEFYDEGLTQWWPEGRVTLAAYRQQWTKLLADGGSAENTLGDMVVQVSPGDLPSRPARCASSRVSLTAASRRSGAGD